MKKLPRDIQRYVRRKTAVCVGLFLILELFVLCFEAVTWDYFSSRTNPAFHGVLFLLLLLMPVPVSGFPFKLLDRSWKGEIQRVDIQEQTDAHYTGGGAKISPYSKNVIYLTVKRSDGKVIQIPIREFGMRSHKGVAVPNEGDVKYHQEEYSVGDTVYHFHGLKEYYVVKQNSSMIDCVICGTKNSGERSSCLECGYSLIK